MAKLQVFEWVDPIDESQVREHGDHPHQDSDAQLYNGIRQRRGAKGSRKPGVQQAGPRDPDQVERPHVGDKGSIPLVHDAI
jgi:ribosome assembly protein YihI (activator of Der GTPase)